MIGYRSGMEYEETRDRAEWLAAHGVKPEHVPADSTFVEETNEDGVRVVQEETGKGGHVRQGGGAAAREVGELVRRRCEPGERRQLRARVSEALNRRKIAAFVARRDADRQNRI